MPIDTQGSLSSMAQLSLKLNPGQYGNDFTSQTDPEKRAALSNQLVSRLSQYTNMIGQAQANKLRMADMAMRQQAFLQQQESQTIAQGLGLQMTERINTAPVEQWGKIISETIAKAPNHAVANQLEQLGNSVRQGSQFQEFNRLQQQQQDLNAQVKLSQAKQSLDLQKDLYSLGLKPETYVDPQTGQFDVAAASRDVSLRKREEKIVDDTREFNQSEALLDKRLEVQRQNNQSNNDTKLEIAEKRAAELEQKHTGLQKDVVTRNKLETKLAGLQGELKAAPKNKYSAEAKGRSVRTQTEVQQDIDSATAELDSVKKRLGEVGDTESPSEKAATPAPEAKTAAPTTITKESVTEAIKTRAKPAEGNRKTGFKYKLNAENDGIYIGGPPRDPTSYIILAPAK